MCGFGILFVCLCCRPYRAKIGSVIRYRRYVLRSFYMQTRLMRRAHVPKALCAFSEKCHKTATSCTDKVLPLSAYSSPAFCFFPAGDSSGSLNRVVLEVAESACWKKAKSLYKETGNDRAKDRMTISEAKAYALVTSLIALYGVFFFSHSIINQ